VPYDTRGPADMDGWEGEGYADEGYADEGGYADEWRVDDGHESAAATGSHEWQSASYADDGAYADGGGAGEAWPNEEGGYDEEIPVPSPRVPQLEPGCPEPLAKYRAALEGWPVVQANDAAYAGRLDELWCYFDTNENGQLSLAEVNGGVMLLLCNMWKQEGHTLFSRYYRSYIRAFNEAKAAGKRGDYLKRADFGRLISLLCLYATWYEVFMAIDGGTEGRTVEDDNRLSRDEWVAALPRLCMWGASWARSVALTTVRAEEFADVDANNGGYIDLQEFCEWAQKKETGGASAGAHSAARKPERKPERKWHTKPLEMRATNASTRQRQQRGRGAGGRGRGRSSAPKPPPPPPGMGEMRRADSGDRLVW